MSGMDKDEHQHIHVSSSIIGKRSPEFVADAICQGSLVRLNSLDYYGQYVLFFFYSSDFSVICPTEMYALQEALPEFKKRNVEVVGISVDPIETHLAWLRTPRSQGGVEGITFTLISDVQKKISKAYCILDVEKGYSLRGAFVVDKLGIVQYGSVNTFEIGRSIPDLLRTIDAIQFTETHRELCPVNWQPGQDTIKINTTI